MVFIFFRVAYSDHFWILIYLVGDYRLSTSTNTLRWAVTNVVGTYGGTATVNQTEADYGAYQLKNTAGINTYQVVAQPWAGNVGSACFTMSIDLETSNGKIYFKWILNFTRN